MKPHGWMLAALLAGLVGCSHAQPRAQAPDEPDPVEQDMKAMKTIGDFTVVGDPNAIQVSGVGLVSGLDGTGGSPPGEYRQMLEIQLQKQGARNTKELLASPNFALVLVTARIPPGTRKGDPIDVEVVLPPGSKAKSLQGGTLLNCPLRNYESAEHISPGKGSNLIQGHILAHARGPLLVGFGEANEEIRSRRARIWQGGVTEIDQPLYLYLNSDQQFASVANNIVNRINASFPDDAQKQATVRQNRRLLMLDEVTTQINGTFRNETGTPRGETAHAANKEVVYLKVPYEYRLDPERYLRVVRFIPLRDSAEATGRYRRRLQEMLLDPKDTIRAALRLEALGKDSVPALRKGLTSEHALVRFAAAEALTFLNTTAGIEELARLAEQHECLRGRCLTAMASCDESISKTKLADLTISPVPQLRYGAFRALLVLEQDRIEDSLEIGGRLFNDAYWVHRAAVTSSPMIHVSTSRRAEVVLFGKDPRLVPPFRLPAGDFDVTAEAGDGRCTVSRFAVSQARVLQKQCGFNVEEVLWTLAQLGGQYTDAVEFLHQADSHSCLNCSVLVDQLPTATPVTLLAAAGGDPKQLKEECDIQEVLGVQQDLGMVPPGRPATQAAPSSVTTAGHRTGAK
jgi:hypothetical protein